MNTTYRKYYLKQAIHQLSIAFTLFWNGVVLNRGHHSKWSEKKQKSRYKSMT